MSCIRAGVGMIDIRGAAGVKFGEVVLPFLVSQVHDAVPGEDHAVAPVAGRHHAIEHIDAALDGLEDVPRRTDAHEVTGFVLRQDIVADLDHLIHYLRRFAYCQTADGVAVAVEVTQPFRSLLTQVRIGAALYNWEEVLFVSVEVVRAVETGYTAVEPTVRAVHRVLGVFLIRRTRAALVKSHHDVGSYLPLDIHHGLRREEQLATVDMGREAYTLFRHLADVG